MYMFKMTALCFLKLYLAIFILKNATAFVLKYETFQESSFLPGLFIEVRSLQIVEVDIHYSKSGKLSAVTCWKIET